MSASTDTGTGADVTSMRPPVAWPEGTFVSLLDKPTRGALLQLGVEATRRPGAVLIREGELSRHLILLVKGFVKVTGASPDGRESLLAIRGRGEVVGELAMLDEQPRSATITAGSDLVVRRIGQDQFSSFLAGHPDAALALSKTVSEKLRSATRYRITLGALPAPVRVARVLSDLAHAVGVSVPEGIALPVPLAQTDIASLAATAEVTVQKAIRSLRSAGILSTGYRRIVVKDEVALRRAGYPEDDFPS